MPGVAKKFALDVCDTASTAGSICTCRLHPSCCAEAALRPDFRPNSSPIYFIFSSAFKVASEVTQGCFLGTAVSAYTQAYIYLYAACQSPVALTHMEQTFMQYFLYGHQVYVPKM